MKIFNRLMLVMRLDLLGLQHGAQEVIEEAQSHDEAENVFPSHDYLRPGPTTSCSGSRSRREARKIEGRQRPSSDDPHGRTPESGLRAKTLLGTFVLLLLANARRLVPDSVHLPRKPSPPEGPALTHEAR